MQQHLSIQHCETKQLGRRERGRLEAKVRSLEETVTWLSRPEVETCAETEGKARTRGTGEA